jgi:hypothetical protein
MEDEFLDHMHSLNGSIGGVLIYAVWGRPHTHLIYLASQFQIKHSVIIFAQVEGYETFSIYQVNF